MFMDFPYVSIGNLGYPLTLSPAVPPGPVGDGLKLMHKKLGGLDGRMHVLPRLKRTCQKKAHSWG